MVKLPMSHHRRDEFCRTYFPKMKRSDLTLNALLPNDRNISYTLRLQRITNSNGEHKPLYKQLLKIRGVWNIVRTVNDVEVF